MTKLLQLTEVEACRAWVEGARSRGEQVGLVPTMGALHTGHLSLVEAAARECDRVVATIFVNPTQFGPDEDLDNYPRDLENDIAQLEAVGADLLFAPEVETIYPAGDTTRIEVGPVAHPWEGATRPTHFQGVATVVLKLLQIVPADRAYFGQKDYQQTLVIRQMVRDLHVPTEVVVCPIVREADGLAKSSRNAYLSPVERKRACVLSESLAAVQALFATGERDASRLREVATERLVATEGVELDYLALLREGTVEPVEVAEVGTVVVVAARVGKTRLIDNLVLA